MDLNKMHVRTKAWDQDTRLPGQIPSTQRREKRGERRERKREERRERKEKRGEREKEKRLE